jgi:hypothetical protein
MSQYYKKESPQKELSFLDFSEKDLKRISKKTVSETSISDLMKVLIGRGRDLLNPALSKGTERLLKQLHGVPMKSNFNKKRRNYNGPRKNKKHHKGRRNHADRENNQEHEQHEEQEQQEQEEE